MTVDLWMLFAAIVLTWNLVLMAATPGIIKDMGWALGNRDKPLELPAWANRANRTAQNMKENLPLFMGLVLLVHVSQNASATSALGAQLFVGFRIAHAVAYYAGISVVRTLMWVGSVVGMILVASALF